MGLVHPDHLFPPDGATRAMARAIYDQIATAPIISPHGHTDPAWFAENGPFPDPAQLFVVPDHYLLRMLVSQGICLDRLGISRMDGAPVETDPRKIWRLFAENYHLFRGTPTRAWLDYSFAKVFDVQQRLSPENADRFYDQIDEKLRNPHIALARSTIGSASRFCRPLTVLSMTWPITRNWELVHGSNFNV